MSELINPALEKVRKIVAAQPYHPVIERLEIGFNRRTGGFVLKDTESGNWLDVTPEQCDKLLRMRQETIEKMGADMFNHGHEDESWDEIDWETARLRVRNPGIPIEVLVNGSNGGGKSYFCASRISRCAVQSKDWLIWCFSLDVRNSVTIQQKTIYDYLPIEYRNAAGKTKRNAKGGMTYGVAGGFTDNKFSLYNGTPVQFRFYGDSADPNSLEGPRPYMVWSDEQIPLSWIDNIKDRLLTHAEKTMAWIEDWKALLEEKAKNPALKFPRARIHELYCGVHLISFTPKGGFTPAVRAFVKGATTISDFEADLLPLKNERGEVTGYERMPKLQYSAGRKAFVYYLHAWNNKFGGNWRGMRAEAAEYSRRKILWKCYGVAESATDVVYGNFLRAAHCMPLERLPAEGSWYHIVDPCDAKRNWFMAWVKISAAEISFIAREWPQEDDFVPGQGLLGPWAIASTGKRFDGDRGPAQARVIHSYKGYADEIERVESQIEALEMKLYQRSDIKNRKNVVRIMDSRAGNTDNMSHSSSETIIEAMYDYGYDFLPSGKASGAEGRIKTTDDSAQFVSDMLDYDEAKATIEGDTGKLRFDGKAPLLRVAECCTNIIFGFENWTNQDGGEGACKDPMDVIRYYAIARPSHFDQKNAVSYVV